MGASEANRAREEDRAPRRRTPDPPATGADRPGDRFRQTHRAKRSAGIDHQARRDRDAQARRRETQHPVHLRSLERERRLEPGAPACRERGRTEVVAVPEHDQRRSPQVADRDGLSCREWVRLRHRDDELLAQQGSGLEHLVAERQDDERDVEHALLELQDEIARTGLVKDEVDRGEALMEARQRRRKDRRGERRRRADGEPPTPQIGELTNLQRRAVDVSEHAPRPGEEHFARGGERDVALHPVEERRPELLFEHADRPRDRWLRDAEVAGRPGEVAPFRDGHEIAELMHLHSHSLPLSQ